MISYEPFWTTLRQKRITQYQLIHRYQFSTGQLSRLRANHHISTHTIETLCKILDCEVQDIVQYTNNF